MKFFFPVFVLFLLITSSCGKKTFDSQKFYSFPKYNTVMERFAKQYTNPENTFVEFAKKPDGYYVVSKSIEDRKMLEEHLFWSMEKKEFLSLPNSFRYQASGMSQTNPVIYGLRPHAYSFDHSLYYNYDQAHPESIAALEDVEELDDTLLECLARAYSGSCMRMIEGADALRKPLGAENKTQFMEWSDKMISTYQRIEERNPKYQTLVGRIRTKMAHEAVFTWWELKRGGHSEDAAKYLAHDFYEGQYLSFARNMLSSCPKNAILFTHGDGDTFPLWYVQEKENFRKDVAVLNVSQMNAGEYLKYYLKTNGLKTTISPEKYADASTEITLIQRPADNLEIPESLPLESVLNGILSGDPAFTFSIENKNYPSFPSYLVHVAFDSTKASGDTTTAKHISFRYDRNQYIFRSDLAQLDILLNAINERPICVSAQGTGQINAHTPQTDNRLLVEEIVFKKNVGVSDLYGNVLDVERNYQLLMNTFTFEGKFNDGFESNFLAINQIMCFNRTADLLAKIGDTTKAIELCDKALKNFPMDKMADLEFFLIGFAHHYAAVGRKNDEQKCLKYAVNALELSLKEAKTTADYQSLQSRTVYMLEDIRKTEDESLLKRMQKVNDAIVKKIGNNDSPYLLP